MLQKAMRVAQIFEAADKNTKKLKGEEAGSSSTTIHRVKNPIGRILSYNIQEWTNTSASKVFKQRTFPD